jgi:hypothetical protein
MFGKMFALDAQAFRVFIDTPKALLYSRLVILIVGLVYGAFAILANADYIISFESPILRRLVVPLFFLAFGLLTVVITKFGLTLLLWAGARGFGGPGRMKQLNLFASIAVAPGLLGVPFLVGSGGIILLAPLVLGVGWMYLICVKILEVTQEFQGVKAYVSVLAVFIFFASIYYIIMPTGPIS